MKNTLKYFGIIAAGTLLGCTGNFENYNTNHYQPSVLRAHNLLPTMFECFGSPQQNDCQFNNCMWACFSGHITAPADWSRGTAVFSYFNAREDFNQSTVNNYYTKVYSTLFRIESLTEKRGAIYSLAQLTRVFAMHMVASLQGPMPYTLVQEGKTAVAYDDEETAWRAMFDDLNAAITNIKAAAESGTNAELASVDQFYRGDYSKWLKFANTLKLRMAIRISGKLPEFAQEMAEEAVADGVMGAVTDSAYDHTNSGQANNGYRIVHNWGELRANACLVSYMNGYNDPRRVAYFTEQTYNASRGYIGVRSGTTSTPNPSTYTNYSSFQITQDGSMPMPVMYAAEAAFLRAEGAVKGWAMGGTAQSFYEQGIRLSFDEFGVAGVDSYLADDTSAPGNHIDPVNGSDSYTNASTITIKWDESATVEEKIERIVTQKWIACLLYPLEGWADFRRTGFPRIFPPTASYSQYGCTLTRQQRRLHFAQSEYNTNETNVTAAAAYLSNGQDSDNTDLWWALKSSGEY